MREKVIISLKFPGRYRTQVESVIPGAALAGFIRVVIIGISRIYNRVLAFFIRLTFSDVCLHVVTDCTGFPTG